MQYNGHELTNRSIFAMRVAAAITGNDPWACGYSVYRGTFRGLQARAGQITREHGGNVVAVWYHQGQVVDHGIEGHYLRDVALLA